MINVSGKVIIITGAAQNIGKAYAETLANSGGRIVLADVSQKVFDTASEITKSSGSECLGVRVDVSKEQETLRMAEETIKKFGRIDALVNNAAIFSSIVKKPFMEITTEEWDDLMSVNLRGMFLCCKAVFPQMKSQRRGKIINISSGTFFSGTTRFLHYVTSKGGVIGFTRALAREVGEYNITVNAIAPGLTMTDTLREKDDSFDRDKDIGTKASGEDTSTTERSRQMMKQRALGREESPTDLVGTVLYLCSDASDFVTGQTIAVNGGDVFH